MIVPGYSLATSVVGFKVLDASSNMQPKRFTKLNLNTMGRPIEVRFRLFSGVISGARCVEFDSNGSFNMSEMGLLNLCNTWNQGGNYVSVVVPLKRKKKKKKKSVWYLWVLGFGLGFGVIVVVGYFVMVLSLKHFRTKRIQVMERQADEDLVLQVMRIGNSKIPSAAVTRTQPVLENGDFP